MTNSERTTVVGPWTIGPEDGDENIPIYGEEMQFISARETRADLEHLRDALIQHLAPEKPAGPTHLAIFSAISPNNTVGWGSLPITVDDDGLSFAGLDKLYAEARIKFGVGGVQLTNLIPLAGA